MILQPHPGGSLSLQARALPHLLYACSGALPGSRRYWSWTSGEMRDTGLGTWGSLHPQDIHGRGVASKCAGSLLSATSVELPRRSPGALPGWPPSTSVLRIFFNLLAQGSRLCERPCVSMCPCRSVQDSGCLVYVLHTWVCLCTCLCGGACSCGWVWVCAGCVSARVGMCGAGGRAARRGARALSESRGRGGAGPGCGEDLALTCGGRRESGEQKGQGRGAPHRSRSSGAERSGAGRPECALPGAGRERMGHGGAAERAGGYLVPRAAGEPGARRGHALPLPVEGLLPMPPGPGRLPRERRQPEARWERRALRGAGGMRSVPRALPLFSSFTVCTPGG